MTFNAPIVVANLFEGVRIINSVNDGKETITADDLSNAQNHHARALFTMCLD
jgi:hypothetical protein